MLAGKLLPVLAGAGAVAAAGGAGYIIANRPNLAFGGANQQPDNVELLERVPSREQQLSRLRDSSAEKPFDLLIIGGGSTGAGAAVDACTRGLRTALIEREDFGSGTSSKSTKLVHGGVRYLEKAVFNLDIRQLKLVSEALHERRLILENAPHLSHPLPILTPCYSWWEVPYYWAGLKAYDLVAGMRNLVMSKYVAPTEALNLMPTLAPAKDDGRTLKGAVMYYDGQFDDARLNVALACTAASAGGTLANYVEAKGLIKNAEGKVTGVRCADRLSGETFDVHARVVINATGPFVDLVRHMSDPGAPKVIMPSAGAHITLPSYLGSGATGLIVPKTKDGRVVFMLPWLDHVIAGTTDQACELTSHPTASDPEVDFILAALSDYLGVKVRRSDVLSVWSGIRPLAADPRAKDTSNAVREHVILEEGDGMITISGGKWTTYRKMAEEVVDTAVATGRLPLNVRPCRSHTVKLIGGERYTPTLFAELAQDMDSRRHHASSSGAGASTKAGQLAPMDAATARHLAQAYGDRARRVLQIAEEQPALSRPLVLGHPFLEAEVVYCARHEYCVTAEDFMSRRTRLAFLDASAALKALPRVVELLQEELGWDRARKDAELVATRKVLATFMPPQDAPQSQPEKA